MCLGRLINIVYRRRTDFAWILSGLVESTIQLPYMLHHAMIHRPWLWSCRIRNGLGLCSIKIWCRTIIIPKLGLALMPDEAQVILKWWLGLPLTPDGTPCLLCHHNMDAWEHHMLTCRSGGDMITRHNQLRDCIADFCNKACLSPQIETERKWHSS